MERLDVPYHRKRMRVRHGYQKQPHACHGGNPPLFVNGVIRHGGHGPNRKNEEEGQAVPDIMKPFESVVSDIQYSEQWEG
jgi:hypothetical protein